MSNIWETPFEHGNGNQTTTWTECIDFYQRLAHAFPAVLKFETTGYSDNGNAIHIGIWSADGEFNIDRIKGAGRPVLLNINGIHPGEPEGVDVCMALVRDLCLTSDLKDRLDKLVLVFIPIYNVDGALTRQDTSRANQNGPEEYGFRGTAKHLDLNRDMIKASSQNTLVLNQIFASWDPDVLVDTHTSNGADYTYVVTLIATQPDKLGGELGEFLRATMLPEIYAAMDGRGWPMCPYVNSETEIPDDGIIGFLDTPRYSTGYAALHHTIGFMPETHMLKPFAERYKGLRCFIECAIEVTCQHSVDIQGRRAQDRRQIQKGTEWPLAWELNRASQSTIVFNGYSAIYEPSRIGSYYRLRYDARLPYSKAIPYFESYRPSATALAPIAYIIPKAWTEVIDRLRANGVKLTEIESAETLLLECYYVRDFEKNAVPFEGRHLFSSLRMDCAVEPISLQSGDWIIYLDQPRNRFIIETLEPIATDSFFKWGFFDSILDRKETFSSYVFEDQAEVLLNTEPELKVAFNQWKIDNPQLTSDGNAVLNFIFQHSKRYREPAYRRYPIYRMMDNNLPI